MAISPLAAWFAATQDLFNQVAAFYFEVIAAHEKVLDCSNQEALTHATHKNPTPIMPLAAIGADIPAMFRRAAIHAALGSARSFYSLLRKWKKSKAKAQAQGKKFTERPPVPPRSWNKSATLYDRKSLQIACISSIVEADPVANLPDLPNLLAWQRKRKDVIL